MILFKTTKDRINYYKVSIYPTLFGDFLIQKEYGAIHFSKPTNIIKEYVQSNREAIMLLLDIAVDKKSSGYLKAK
ncbi:MAG: hypothetical protein H8E76_02760 [Helicobacteraceae bacterium]|nr:hypothetical protein [Candidatus Sulfurimonas ponti]MBL6972890.1 hypothetical protein [Sulfurimonas sp.]